MKVRNFAVFALIMTVAALTGCSKKVDPKKPIAKIQQEVQTMSVADLESTAAAYAKEVRAQKVELGKITDEMKGLPVKEIFSDKSKSIKNRLSKIQVDATALLERYQIYVNKLQEKGADLSKVRLD
ncbi:MAG TPA: hypothetical protein PKI45_05235 [Candidatus Omnitrophota bacterium]|nr:hypothetical protein [Candidatus Omnitrophota bacterium]